MLVIAKYESCAGTVRIARDEERTYYVQERTAGIKHFTQCLKTKDLNQAVSAYKERLKSECDAVYMSESADASRVERAV